MVATLVLAHLPLEEVSSDNQVPRTRPPHPLVAHSADSEAHPQTRRRQVPVLDFLERVPPLHQPRVVDSSGPTQILPLLLQQARLVVGFSEAEGPLAEGSLDRHRQGRLERRARGQHRTLLGQQEAVCLVRSPLRLLLTPRLVEVILYLEEQLIQVRLAACLGVRRLELRTPGRERGEQVEVSSVQRRLVQSLLGRLPLLQLLHRPEDVSHIRTLSIFVRSSAYTLAP